MGGFDGRGEIKLLQLAHHQLMNQQGPHFNPHSTAKTNDKAHFSGRMVSSGISDVAFASVYSEKSRQKKLMMMMKMMMMIIINMNKSQEMTVFSGCQK